MSACKKLVEIFYGTTPHYTPGSTSLKAALRSVELIQNVHLLKHIKAQSVIQRRNNKDHMFSRKNLRKPAK